MTQLKREPARARPDQCSILHLGLGAFHRAHQAVYIQQCLNNGDTEWGIVSANLRSNHPLVSSLRAHDHRYHVAEYRDSEHVTLREIAAIDDALYAGRNAGQEGIPDDREALLERIAHPVTRIITLTVTEKGYCLVPSTGELDTSNETIQTDLADPKKPHSVPGMLTEGLHRRRAQGAGGLTILSCDNMPENGRRTRHAVLGMAKQLAAALQEPALPEWIAANVSFPCSMVDRIVPTTTDADRQRLAELGVDDPNAVVCEAFSQWVVEDDFICGRPAWESVGVEMVADVTPFETMKLRMLNGAHSLLAYLGRMADMETVAQAVGHEAIVALLRRYMRDEAAPTLNMPAGVDLDDYREQLLARFANDSLAHRLQQIATDGSQKIPQRWLAGALQQLEEGGRIDCIALGVAGWIRYVAGTHPDGQEHDVNDPMADQLAARHADNADDLDALITSFLGDRRIFDPQLAQSHAFTEAVKQAYHALTEDGPMAAIGALQQY